MSKTKVARPAPKSPAARAAMDELASVSVDLLHVQNAIEIHRSAIVGALADRRRYQVPDDDPDAFIDPVLESFGHLGEHVETLARRLFDVGTRLHGMVPCK